MSKKSNTNERKISVEKNTETISSHLESPPSFSFTYTPKNTLNTSNSTRRLTPHAVSYAYVMHDVKQTAIITSLLFFTSVILYFIIQNQIINLSVFGY